MVVLLVFQYSALVPPLKPMEEHEIAKPLSRNKQLPLLLLKINKWCFQIRVASVPENDHMPALSKSTSVFPSFPSLCNKNINVNSPVAHDEFQPALTFKKAFLSAYLGTETKLKVCVLQSQFTAKYGGVGGITK